ncbi:TetR/AcrR family transcriptional regulator [Streptomyces sp. LHD-70]|uniref:TetR/AcrR family transcriptional regulator n=1 Tax=Streptomyces sp. LHD-70 TaxID=3072140 RepID=UPI00280D9925|nr:TetR/AcrR family transcriptional regulator [Streptomyces sp. LHD-70]MDQ8705653.1 TetR/AcrR family transcriptional regulator [Streptomyces sp. LHD-70]
MRRRRREILQAAAQLMEESGYHAVSMQAVAEQAEISVGLIYKYFGNKEDLLRAVIVDILEDFQERVPAAIEEAGDDPVDRLFRGFQEFCRVIDAKLDATVLAYRESQTLDVEGRRQLMELEIRTAAPIKQAVADGISQGVFRDVDPDLVTHNLALVAHGWALKHWNLADRFTVDEYVEREFELLLASVVRHTDVENAKVK